jgi:hypothetical protein
MVMAKQTRKVVETVTIHVTAEDLKAHCLALAGGGFSITEKIKRVYDSYDGDSWIFDGYELTKVTEIE